MLCKLTWGKGGCLGGPFQDVVYLGSSTVPDHHKARQIGSSEQQVRLQHLSPLCPCHVQFYALHDPSYVPLCHPPMSYMFPMSPKSPPMNPESPPMSPQCLLCPYIPPMSPCGLYVPYVPYIPPMSICPLCPHVPLMSLPMSPCPLFLPCFIGRGHRRGHRRRLGDIGGDVRGHGT